MDSNELIQDEKYIYNNNDITIILKFDAKFKFEWSDPWTYHFISEEGFSKIQHRFTKYEVETKICKYDKKFFVNDILSW